MGARWIYLLLLTVGAVACVDAPNLGDGADDSERPGGLQNVVGGTRATDTDFPSALSYAPHSAFCTGAKVAPNKILTATHCPELDHGVDPAFASQQLWVTSAPKPPVKEDNVTPIPSTDVRSGYVQIRLSGLYMDPTFMSSHSWHGSMDVAIFVVADESVPALANIPIAEIEYSRVGPGTPFFYVGYGCDQAGGKFNEPIQKKFFKRTTISPGESGVADAAEIDPTYLLSFENSGPNHGCPGDSGGPQYHADSGKIIGVVSAGTKGTRGDVSFLSRTSGTWLEKVLADQPSPAYYLPLGTNRVQSSCLGGGGFVVGAINDKFNELGGCESFLGAPRDSEKTTPDTRGRYSVFEKGSIYWTPETKAHEVHGAIRDEWENTGWEGGTLGYPTSDVTPTSDMMGSFSTFQKGVVYSSPKTGAHAVLGKILEKWNSVGGFDGSGLGYPISDEYDASGGRRSDFQNGSITWAGGQATVEKR